MIFCPTCGQPLSATAEKQLHAGATNAKGKHTYYRLRMILQADRPKSIEVAEAFPGGAYYYIPKSVIKGLRILGGKRPANHPPSIEFECQEWIIEKENLWKHVTNPPEGKLPTPNA